MGSEKKKRRRESEGGDQSSKKKKKVKAFGIDNDEDPQFESSEAPVYVSPIASPMAARKLAKKLFKLIGHAGKEKAVRRGIKEVVLALRKDEKGVCVIAGDVYPVDVVAHIPLLCEEAEVPYCYIPKKADLGAAGLTKRPTSVVFVSKKQADSALSEEIDECAKLVSEAMAELDL